MELLHKLVMTVNDLNQNVHWISRMMTMYFPEDRWNNFTEISNTTSSQFANARLHINFKEQQTTNHERVLQRMFEEIVNQVDLESSSVLDAMYEADGISHSDQEHIRKQPIMKDKIRGLINVLINYSEQNVQSFIHSLNHHGYPDLASKIETELSNEKQRNPSENACLSCTIKKRVNVRDVIDRLYSSAIITRKVIEMVLAEEPPNLIWNQIYQEMSTYVGRLDVFAVFCSSLQGKYDDIITALRKKGFKIHCICNYTLKYIPSCPRNRRPIPVLLSSESGSWSDISSQSSDLGQQKREMAPNHHMNGNLNSDMHHSRSRRYARSKSARNINEAGDPPRQTYRRPNQSQSLRISPSYSPSEDQKGKSTQFKGNAYGEELNLPNWRRKTDTDLLVRPKSYRSTNRGSSKYGSRRNNANADDVSRMFIRSVTGAKSSEFNNVSQTSPRRSYTDSDIYFGSHKHETNPSTGTGISRGISSGICYGQDNSKHKFSHQGISTEVEDSINGKERLESSVEGMNITDASRIGLTSSTIQASLPARKSSKTKISSTKTSMDGEKQKVSDKVLFYENLSSQKS